MFCPQCRMEYRPEITKCPDCEVDLVIVLPAENAGPADGEEPIPEYDDLVTVFRTNNYANLLIARSLLESADVSFWTKGDSLSSLFFSGAIMVRPEDESEAREILAELENLEEPGEDAGD
jgi:hypothetical protein